MNNFRATVIPDNPYRKMIIALVIAILSTISAFMVLSASSGVARAGSRDFCPDGHTCYWAEQRQTERRACHVQHADLGQGWTWTEERCGLVEPGGSNLPTATATPFQPEPTRTSRPLPSPTRRPAGDADPSPTSRQITAATLETTRSPRQYPAATNTPTPLPLLFSSSEVGNPFGSTLPPACDICQMLPPLQTMAAAQATMAARP